MSEIWEVVAQIESASKKDGETQTVSRAPGSRLKCSCKSFEFSKDRRCRHIDVWVEREERLAIQEEVPSGESD